MKIKRSLSLAAGLGVVAAGFGGLAFSTPTYAAACMAAEGLAQEGFISNESEYEYAVVNELANVKLGEDFTITCEPSYITDDFTLDLNGHTLTSEVAWALDIETGGKTLTVQDSVGGGKYTFNDAGIWAQNGANVTVESGTIEGTAGRGRGIQVWSGKYTMTGGNVLVANESVDFSSVLVFGDNASAEISGNSKITSTNGKALFVSGAGNAVTFSGGEISSTGDYALMISDLATLTMSGGTVEAGDFPLTVFDGSTANVSAGTVHSRTGFAVSANFMESPAYMNISGGTLTSDGDFAILFPGDPASVSKLTISGTPTITGAGGVIAMNSGILEITGGTLTSLGTESHSGTIGNGSNGFTTSVLGLAAGYADVTATISGGTFINQHDSELIWTTDVCKELGTNKTCNMNLSITGGYFSGVPAREYVDANYTVYDTGAVAGAQYEVMAPMVPTIIESIVVAKGDSVDAADYYDADTLTYGSFNAAAIENLVTVDGTVMTGVTAGRGLVTYVIPDMYGSGEAKQTALAVYDVEAGDDTETVSGADDAVIGESALDAMKDFLENGTAGEEYVTEGAVFGDLAGLREDIAGGKQVLSELEHEEYDDEAVAGAEELFREEAAELGFEFLDGEKFATVYDAGVYAFTDHDGVKKYYGWMQKLGKAIALTFNIPEAYQNVPEGYSRTFYVVRRHENYLTDEVTYKRLDATVSVDGTSLTTESDLFSEFAITYVDIAAPETGANTVVKDFVEKNGKLGIWMLACGMMMLGYGLILLGKQERVKKILSR